ncbi:MAG: arginine--tRNA ligase [Deltaproteobacteria bacterium]|nr:arginine--tRNA ligase [Deltaproteobacteria bacterium]
MKLEAMLDEVGRRALREALDLTEDAPALLRPTQDARFGDYQLNAAMALAKKLKRPPRELAGALAERLQGEPAIASAEVAGPGFVNLTLDDTWLAARLGEDLRDHDADGVPPVAKPETIVVDFSSPNIAKQMHVGHLRSTILGDAVVRLLRQVGHHVIGDNHLGDWGTQFGLLIVGMREWGDEAKLESEPVDELERVYKLARARAKEDEDFAESARAELAKLQTGDAANLALWERFVAATRHTLDAIYARLGVTFDEWLGESAYHELLPGVVKTLEERGLAREDQGALCVFWGELADAPPKLKKQKEPFIVRKRDGAFLYSTTDIATILVRRDRFEADRSIYVVGSPQALHFQQLFALAKMLDVDMRLEHVGFGAILGDDGKVLRTRDGKAVRLSDLLDEAEERSLKRIEEARAEGVLRIPEEDVAAAAHAIGIGAVKYADLSQNRLSDYRFDWDRMISFKGNAGPYLQYNYARVRSIFRKAELDMQRFEAELRLDEALERVLARRLARFGDVVHRAAEQAEPHLVAEHLYELARGYSAFYKEHTILGAEGATRASRLALTALTGRQLKRGLGLLGVDVIERM